MVDIKTMWKKNPDIDHASNTGRVYTSETGVRESSSTSDSNVQHNEEKVKNGSFFLLLRH